MPNKNSPHGFKPTRAIYGEHGRTNSYSLTASNAKVAAGDVVVRTNDGLIDRGAASATQIIGVAATGAAASSGASIHVYDNPGQMFEAQTDDGTGTLTAQTGVNANANFVATASTGDISLMEILQNSAANTATLPFRIMGLYPAPDNAFGEFNRLEVMINNHVLGTGTGTTGLST